VIALSGVSKGVPVFGVCLVGAGAGSEGDQGSTFGKSPNVWTYSSLFLRFVVEGIVTTFGLKMSVMFFLHRI